MKVYLPVWKKNIYDLQKMCQFIKTWDFEQFYMIQQFLQFQIRDLKIEKHNKKQN